MASEVHQCVADFVPHYGFGNRDSIQISGHDIPAQVCRQAGSHSFPAAFRPEHEDCIHFKRWHSKSEELQLVVYV